MRAKNFRPGGELDVLALPLKQLDPHLVFQPLDGLAQGGLGDMEGLGRAGKALQPGHLDKILELEQFHTL